MTPAAHIFWIVAVALLGAIIGSFLNVVVYRLPRGMSVASPAWSFCPACRHRIRWQHNVPILGWLMLRGRCHDCQAPIGPAYPVIEGLSAMLFLFVWDAIILSAAFPGTTAWQQDWPLLLAGFVLFAVLLAVAAMDFESYSLDIDPLIFAMFAGVALHSIRGLAEARWVAVGSGAAAGVVHQEREALGLLPASLVLAGVAMGAAWCLTALAAAFVRRRPQGPQAAAEVPVESPPMDGAVAGARFRPLPVMMLAAVLVLLAVWLALDALGVLPSTLAQGQTRGIAGTALFFICIVAASMVQREADQQIIDEIESEKHQARGMALRELAGFLPAIVTGALVFLAFRWTGRLEASLSEILLPKSMSPSWASHAEAGLQSIAAIVYIAAVGWGVRILGTLAFGKEAFGSGDIYIMAAIAAVLGFWCALFAFFTCAFFALAAHPIVRLSKHNRAIPFGPWLSLGAFCMLWLYRPLLRVFELHGEFIWSLLAGRKAS